jgi:hypothetical protein
MKITEQAGDRARSTGRRAGRALRGEPHGPGWVGTTMIAALTGAAGAIAAFLLDPARGRGRRARLIDQGGATVRRTIRQSGRALRTIRTTASGSMAAATHPGDGDTARLDDATLAAKLETRLFRDPSVPKGSINVNVERGIAILRGEVPDAEMRDRLASEAAAVGGVWSVHNLLHLPGQPIEEEPAQARS